MTHSATAIAVAALIVAGAMGALAQGDESAGLRFRRILVPQEDLESQIRGLLPMRRDEFDRHLQQAAAARQIPAPAAQAHIVSADYTARLEGETLVDGTARLSIDVAGTDAQLVRLGPCNLALEDSRWEAANATGRVGQTPQGELVGLVESNGVLELGWSLRGKSLAAGALQFTMQLPPAPSSSVTLDLPADRTLVATGGFVAEGAPVPGTSDRKNWRINVGGHGQALLTIQPETLAQSAGPIIGVRETSTYSLVGSSLDLQTVFDLNLFDERTAGIKLRIERPLELISIRRGEQSLTWRTLVSDESSIIVDLDPAAILGSGNAILELNATAPWSPEPPANLPRLAVVDGLYHEGRANVVAPEWLRTQARPLRGCWQAAVVPAAPGRNVDQLQFHLQEPTAAIEVATDSRTLRLSERTGTQITIDASHVSAVATTELTALGGERYQVEAQIPRRWLIDAVDVLPAQDVSDRTLVLGDSGLQVLRLNLRTPLSATRPLRITIRARHRRPAGEQSLPSGFFRVASFLNVREAERLVAIRTLDPGIRLQLAEAAGLKRLDASTLPESQMKLFESPPGSLLFSDNASSASIAAELTRAPVRYRAELRMEARLEGQTLQESVSLRCLPDASAIGQVLVRLSPRPPGSIEWSLIGQDRRAIEVEPVAIDADPAAADGLYRIRLAKPRAESFELRGEWMHSMVSSEALTLASAPEASSQTGIVEVHSIDATPLIVAPDKLLPQLVLRSDADQWTTLRGRYLYQPDRQASPRLRMVSAAQMPSPAIVSSLTLQSRFDGRGTGEHEAALEIENHGLRRLKLQVPLAARDIRQLDARGRTSPVARLSPELIAIDLPAGERLTTVRLRYRSDDATLGWMPFGKLTAPLVLPDIPIFMRQWKVSIAPGLAFASGEKQSPPGSLGSRLGRRFSSAASPKLAAAARQPAAGEAVDRAFQDWASAASALPAGDIATIEVYQPAVIQGLALGVLLGAMGLALLLRRSGAWLISAALLVFSGGLLLGPVSGLLVTGAAVGLLLGGLPWLLWPVRQPTIAPAELPSTRPRQRSLSSGLLLIGSILAAVFAASAVAQQPATADKSGPESRASNERVVIPVDDKQQPAGDYVYLTAQLYERLQALTDAGTADLPPWIIAAAHYELPPTARAGGAAVSIDEIQARFDVEVLRAPAVVELPVRRDQVLLLEGRTRISGVPVQISWRSDGAALLVPIDTTGSHSLELAFGAPAKKNNEGTLLELLIPTVSRATVATRASAEAPPTVLSALGGLLANDPPDEGPRIALGPTDQLTVLWPPAEGAQLAARVEAEQLLWWNLRPGSVVVEGKFKFRPIGGALQRVSIAVDPRLRLLPGSISPAPARLWIEDGSPAIVHLELAESTSAEATVRGSWLWIGASGTGNLLLPPIQARADRLVRAWCGVSAEQPLAASAPQPSASSLMTEDFLIAWSEAVPEPALAIDELARGAKLQVTAEPAASQPLAASTSDWSFRDDRVVLHHEMRLTQVSAQRYQQRLELPPLLKVSRVEIVTGEKPVPLRWDQRADGSLIITHLAPPPPDHVLTFEAEARLGNRDRWNLPQIQLHDATSVNRLCRIYRQEDVLVQLTSAAGWQADDTMLMGARSDEMGRLVAALRSDQPAVKPPSVQRTANRPVIGGRVAVRIAEDDGAWSAEADLDLHISSGLIDVVRLEVPPEWSGPFEITPAVEHHVRPVPGSAAHELTIWPQQAVGESLRLSIRALLRSADGQALHVPAIRLAEADSLEHYLLLDARFGGDPLRWETTGLQAIPAAVAKFPAAWLASDEEAYRVVAERYDATPLALPQVKSQPQVALAETSLDAQPDDRLLSRTTFFVDPAGAAEVEVVLPSGSRLASMTIDGQLCFCRAAGLRSWRVAVPALHVPLQLEVVYDSPSPAATNDRGEPVAQPWIVGPAPRHTIWRLSGLSPAVLAENQRAAPRAEAELARMEAVMAVLANLAESPPGELPPASVGAAWRHWQPQFDQANQRLQALGDLDSGTSARLKQRRDAATRRVDELADRLIQSGVLPMEEVAINTTSESASISAAERRQTVVAAEGVHAEEISVVLQRPLPAPAKPAWLAAAAMALLGLALGLLARSATMRSVLSAQPFLTLALVGVLWWFVAPWPWLGCALVAMAIGLALYSPWSGQSGDPSRVMIPRPDAR